MVISITKSIVVDFEELATWIVERAGIEDIAEHIANENDIDEDDSSIGDQLCKNEDEFWDDLYKAIIKYCEEQL